MGIKTWSPGLAFLYLATEGSPRDPAVYQQIVNNTLLAPLDYVGNLCSSSTGTGDLKKCRELIKTQCTQTYTNSNFNFSPDNYFLLYNGRDSQGVCACINSSLVPPSKGSITNNPAAMCFDEQCATQHVPKSNPIITMKDLLDLNDTYCTTQCNALNDILQGQANNIQNLNQSKFTRLCDRTITMTFNTTFFVQLMIPTIIITALIPLGFGINKASIIVMVLTLLTLTGVSFYLGKLFASRTECDDVSPGGKLPLA